MQDLPHEDCKRSVKQSLSAYTIPQEKSIIHRVEKKRINYQNVSGLIEGADDAPDERVRKIHVCGCFLGANALVESCVLAIEGEWRESSRKTKLRVAGLRTDKVGHRSKS